MKRRPLAITLLVAALFALSTIIIYAAVELSYFGGERSGNTVTLRWGTGSEINTSYFNVWRSEENLPIEDGRIDTTRAVEVESNVTASCSAVGNDYEVEDTVSSDVDTYYYYLESVNVCTGVKDSEFTGPPGASNRGLEITRQEYMQYLPLIQNQ